ncbi:MAG: hypothetical protein NT166_08665 [Candidatus Aminicenantes bacterium]|nr:hypothetical protein [Candidatus Aminicenantes bacterium]
MYILGYSISFFLEYSLLVLKSLKDDVEALNLLSHFTYSIATIEEGLNVHEIAQQMESAQIQYHAEMNNVGSLFNALYKYAHEQFMDYSGIILLEFKDDMDSTLKSLAAEASAERKPINWLKKSKEFYTYVLKTKKIMDRIAQYGFIAEKLDAAFNKVVEAEDAKALYFRGHWQFGLENYLKWLW